MRVTLQIALAKGRYWPRFSMQRNATPSSRQSAPSVPATRPSLSATSVVETSTLSSLTPPDD